MVLSINLQAEMGLQTWRGGQMGTGRERGWPAEVLGDHKVDRLKDLVDPGLASWIQRPEKIG